MRVLLAALALCQLLRPGVAVQSWVEQPQYRQVNPHGNVVMPCIINDLKGKCHWEKDGAPIGMEPGKYEWAGEPAAGDCSLRIHSADLQYDDGVWQCQVTASSYKVQDALISDGAQLVVRESPSNIFVRRVGDEGHDITAKAGEKIDLECMVTGGNPPAKLRWFVRDTEIQSGHRQEDSRNSMDQRTWVSVSRLELPVSKVDNGATIRCLAEHPTLETPISAKAMLTIHYPPSVSIETSQLDYLEEGKDPLTLRCVSDSNPPASVIWRKEGLEGILSPDSEINFSPVTRHTAGLYSCTAENGIGQSKAAYVDVDVKYSPSILTVGPSQVVEAQMNDQAVLSCEAESNPPPRYQWLQKLPSNEVLIRGYERQLIIQNVTYDYQGEFVCKAMNELRGEERSVQSDPIRVKVRGKPQVMKYSASNNIHVQDGEDAVLKVLFCADPMPKESWHLSDPLVGSGNNIILAAGTRHGRFEVEKTRNVTDKEDCYVTALRIHGAHAGDSHGYLLNLSNSHGSDLHTVHLVVKDRIPRDYLIGAIVGAILILLTLILLCIWMCKSGCCSTESKKNFKPTDIESEKTDVESTHSSNLSGFPHQEKANNIGHVVIPPDALYATSEKHHSYHQQQHAQHYVQQQDALFNDSKESLRPDLMSRQSQLTPTSQQSSNLNRTTSSSGELNTSSQRISYNDLCFPKTSNYGSMKKKKHHVGVDCRLNQQQQQQRHFYP